MQEVGIDISGNKTKAAADFIGVAKHSITS
jgi:hypothetical protein